MKHTKHMCFFASFLQTLWSVTCIRLSLPHVFNFTYHDHSYEPSAYYLSYNHATPQSLPPLVLIRDEFMLYDSSYLGIYSLHITLLPIDPLQRLSLGAVRPFNSDSVHLTHL